MAGGSIQAGPRLEREPARSGSSASQPLPPATGNLPPYLPPVIRLSHVYKDYPKGAALKDVSLHVAQGEFVFLTGHSGAGKSTLLKLMYAALQPSSGEVRVSGFSITDLGANKVPRLRRRLGIVLQDFGLLSERTAEENVAFALEVTGVRADSIPSKVMRVLTQVGLAAKDAGLSDRTLRRRTAAGRHRARAGERPGHPAGGRAYRKPR